MGWIDYTFSLRGRATQYYQTHNVLINENVYKYIFVTKTKKKFFCYFWITKLNTIESFYIHIYMYIYIYVYGIIQNQNSIPHLSNPQQQ